MKSFIATAFMAFAATSATAGNVSVGAEYEFYNGNSGSPDYNALSLIPTYTTGPVTLDLRLQHARTDTKDIFNTVEAGAKYTMPVAGKLAATLRGRYGVAFANGTFNDFYTVEPGVVYAMSPKVALNGSYRFRNAFADSSSYAKSNTMFVGADYTASKATTLGVKLFRETGEVDGTGVQASYTQSF